MGGLWSRASWAALALVLGAIVVAVPLAAPATAGGEGDGGSAVPGRQALTAGEPAPGEVPSTGPAAAVPALSLEEALARALSASPRLQSARIALRQARTGLKMARSAAERAPDEPPEMVPIPGLPLPATTTRDYVELAKGKELYPRQAEMGVTVAEAGLRAAEMGVRFETEKAFYELMKARDLLGVSRLAVERGERQLDQARAFFDAGTVARTDLLSAEVAVAGLRAGLVTADKVYRLAMMSLDRVMAQDLEALWDPVAGETAPAGAATAPAGAGASDLEAALASAGENRVEVVLAREDLACKALERDILSRYWTPNVYECSLAGDAAAAAEAGLREKQIQVEFEVRAAYLNIEDARQRIAVLEKAVEQAREGLRLAELRYSAGLATSLEVLSAQVSLSQAEAQAVQARCDLSLALSAFRTAAAMAPEAD